MRIAFFTDTFVPQLNGVATSVSNFYQEIKKIEPAIEIIAPKIKDHTDKDKKIIRLSSSKIWPTIPDSARIPLPNKEWLQLLDKNYEIIHAHGNGLFSFLGLIIARRKKTPFILTLHTLWDQYNHYFFGGKILTPTLINKLLKTFANNCTSIIAPSKKMKNKLIELGIKKPILVVPNFIDIKKFTSIPKGFLHKKLDLKSNSKILLAVGRLGKEKNFSFLIKMFTLLKISDENTHLIIVGEGNEKESLYKQIKHLKLENFIHLTGGIPIDYMPKVYADADIFVFASTTEVHPMVAIEAAASSLPLVVVKDSAFDDIVDDKVNGFQTSLDPKQFAQKVTKLLTDDKLRKQMSQKSSEIISKRFVKEKIILDLLKIYQGLLSTKSPN